MNIFSARTQQYIWSFVDLLRQLLKIIPIDWSMIHLFEEILKESSFCWVLSWVYWVLSDAFLGYSIRTFEIYTLYIIWARGRKNESLWCILVKEGWFWQTFGRFSATERQFWQTSRRKIDNFAEISIFVVYLHGHLKRGILIAFWQAEKHKFTKWHNFSNIFYQSVA